MSSVEVVWQIPSRTEGGLVHGLGGFLQAFGDVTPWSQLAVLLSSSARYGGQSALELLQAGEEEAARSIAATYGEQG
jgi:hypothetical protein